MNNTQSRRQPWFLALVISVVALCSILVLLGLQILEVVSQLPSYTYTILSTFYLTTLVSTGVISYLGRKTPETFIQLVLVSTVIKLIVNAAMMFIISYQKPGDLMSNVFFFLFVYVLFTVTEVVCLLRNIRS